MQNIAVQKVKDMESAARQWIQRWLGRELEDDEEVTIMAFPPHPAPGLSKRRAALKQMEYVLNDASENLKNVSDEEFNDAVDEAMGDIRPRKA